MNFYYKRTSLQVKVKQEKITEALIRFAKVFFPPCSFSFPAYSWVSGCC